VQLEAGYRFAVDNPHLVAVVQSAAARRQAEAEAEARRHAGALQRYARVRRELDEHEPDVRDNLHRMVRLHRPTPPLWVLLTPLRLSACVCMNVMCLCVSVCLCVCLFEGVAS
jgi:hypothetical protein